MDVETLSFEDAFRELEETVRKLEEGGLSLEESIALFEQGMKLAQYCSQKLDQAELRVNQLLPTPEGEYRVAPFQEEPGR